MPIDTHSDVATALSQIQSQTRRQFLGSGLGALFLATMSFKGRAADAADDRASSRLDFKRDATAPLAALPPQFAPRARRVIHLHMLGAPSQLELFDYKPVLAKHDGQDCPTSFLVGKQFAFITGVPKLLGAQYPFKQSGQSGAWMSDRVPHLAKHVDKLCFIRSMRTDQFNHAPAQLLMHSGQARFGYASMGAWVTYGLGTENQNLPGYIVLTSGGRPDGGKQLWGSGYLPSVYQGVECRSHGDPVLYLQNPPGQSRSLRRTMLDALASVNQETFRAFGDPETITRVAQYEMAFRMQLQASDALDIHRESEEVRSRYGAKLGAATFANNCLVARRLAERGVRYIELFDWGWDTHGDSPELSINFGLKDKCVQVDQPIGALLTDLSARGLLEDTLVIWTSEFGRTPMRETRQQMKLIGRDHHPGAFTIWMAGGGVKPGFSHGETDEMGYEIVRDPVEVRDLHATILYLLGFDHKQLVFPYQGLDQKLTGVKPARVVAEILI